MTSEVGVRYHGIRRLESPVHDPGGLILKAVALKVLKNNARPRRGSGWSPETLVPRGWANTQTGRAQGFKRELPLCRPLGPE